MLRILLWKDLRRAARNPLPWLIFLLVPLCAVAVVGVIFGGGGNAEQSLGRIRFGLVDEDGSLLGRFLGGMGGNAEAGKYLDPVALERAAAMAQLNANKLSAVVIIPKNFTRDFLDGRAVKLELIKNPAESLKPTALEEMFGVLVTGLNALDRNFAPELAQVRALVGNTGTRSDGSRLNFFSDEANLRRVDALLSDSGKKLETLRAFLDPPLVGWTETKATDVAKPAGPRFNIFGGLLQGMAAMFLLFLGGIGMNDLHREVQLRTLERYQSMRDSLAPFLVSKFCFTGVMLLLCAVGLFGGGALVFGVVWRQPLPLLALVLAYIAFVAGVMALVVAAMPDQRKAETLRSMVSMGLGMAGGCAFPIEGFSAGYRAFANQVLPTTWFVSAARALERADPAVPWTLAAAKLVLVGSLCLALAAGLVRRRFLQGVRA
jgi:hypothetical protein